MPNRNQGQSVFKIQLETCRPPSPQESPTFNLNVNVLNTNFEQPRGRGIKQDKPWNSNTSVFRATSADAPLGLAQNANLPQLCETPQSTYSVLNFRQLPTPQTPSNQPLNLRHSGSPDFHPPMFLDSEISCSHPLSSPDSPLRSLNLSSLLDDSVSYSEHEHESSTLLLPLSLDVATQLDQETGGKENRLLPGPSGMGRMAPIPRSRRKYLSQMDTVNNILAMFRDARMSLADFLVLVLSNSQNAFSTAFFADGNSGRFHDILDVLWQNKKGGHHMKDWMRPHAIDLVCNIIHEEMDCAKPQLRMTTTEITPEFISNWDINGLMEPISSETTPVWSKILEAATESRTTQAKPNSRNRQTGRSVISAQVHYLRSFFSCKVQVGLGLMAWSTGASRQLISVLNQACLSMSYPSILAAVDTLAERSLDGARRLAQGPHGCSYDNINMTYSIHVEQALSAPNKVQSGTFGVLYELLGANPDHMKLAMIMKRLKNAAPLKITDLRPSNDAWRSYQKQTIVNIVTVLVKHTTGFSKQKEHPDLQHLTRRRLPSTYKTKFFPLKASTIEEASVKGNILVHDDIYLVQLQRDPNSLNDLAIPAIHDQLTNARNRGAQAMRKKDITPWFRREIFQLGFGIFHLTMNLIWALLHSHRGSINQIGSLSYFFAVLEKVRLNADRPDFHTLLAALTQILDGLILNAWRRECGFSSLEQFCKSNPTPSRILELANAIIRKYATPMETCKPVANPPKSSDLANSDAPNQVQDIIHENVVRLTRDLLYVAELVAAVSDGDFGRVEDILPDLACIFRAAGSNNYSTEILHFLFNLKEVWTPEFTNIMRDNMLINPSGKPGHAMGVDLNIEHLIRSLKTVFASKGIYSNWDRLGNISAAINYLESIKIRVSRSMHANYQGSTHKAVDTSELVWRIANKAQKLQIQEVATNRERIATVKSVPDLRTLGREKFAASSLATFNKKVRDIAAGKVAQIENDELPVPQFGFDNIDQSDEIEGNI